MTRTDTRPVDGDPTTVHRAPSTVEGVAARTIVVASAKGGAGKTTAAVTVAAAAAATRRVLLVDSDDQGAATSASGVDAAKPTLYEVLAGKAKAADAVRQSPVENLDVLPADGDLAAAALELPRQDKWREALVAVLRPLRPRYDLIVVDTPPGLSVVSFAALVAADSVFVTANASFPDLRVLSNLFAAVEQASTVPGARPKVAGIIPSRIGRRTIHRDEVLDELAKRWPGLVLPELPERVAFQDAAVARQPITAYAPRSTAADAARRLTEEVLTRAQPSS